MTGNQYESGRTAYQVEEAIARLQDGQFVTITSAAVVNALMTRLVADKASLNLAVRVRWGAGESYSFLPLMLGDGITPGVY